MKNCLLNRHHDERGVALVMTLSFLVLVTLLVVAFAINMRVEGGASRCYSDQVKARQLAMAGVDEAVARLRVATPKIGSTGTKILTNYATAPGISYVITNGVPAIVPLCSTGTVDDLLLRDYHDINYGSRRLINRQNSTNILVGWVNWSHRNSPRPGRTNLIGRYCFWVDDESSKININAACGMPASPAAPRYLPVDIDVRVLNYAAVTNASYEYARSTGYFSPESWWLSGAVPAWVCFSNAFKITAFSHDTRFTPWGAPCFNFNAYGGATNLTDDAGKKLYMQGITNMLSNANLNLWFGQTFRQKYGNNLMQIAANIVDYIDTDNGLHVPTDSSGDPPTYLGLERTPYLNELVISNSFKAYTNMVGELCIDRTTATYVELWYMYPPPALDYDLSGHTITIQDPLTISSDDPAFGSPQHFTSPLTLTLSGVVTPGPWSGTYAVFKQDEPATITVRTTANGMRFTLNGGTITAVLKNGTGNRLDYAWIPMTNHTFTVFKNSVFLSRPTNHWWVSACRDPRSRPVNRYWNPIGGGITFSPGSLGGFNHGTVFYGATNIAPGATAQLMGDGDYSCHTNIANLGTLTSVGELAFIHTGVPWRTLVFRPQYLIEKNNNVIPDWAMLDLFCTTNKLEGRININSQVFTNNAIHNSATAYRRAVLQGLTYNRFAYRDTGYGGPTSLISSNIQNRLWNPDNLYIPPDSWLIASNCYVMLGQLCEVRGMSSNIVVKEIAERGLRNVSNLITTRSSTFGIWAVGQTIVDVNKDGAYDTAVGDFIGAEVVIHAIVERYENLTSAATNQVRFRTRYYQFYAN